MNLSVLFINILKRLQMESYSNNANLNAYIYAKFHYYNFSLQN